MSRRRARLAPEYTYSLQNKVKIIIVCESILSFQQICLYLLEKSLIENDVKKLLRRSHCRKSVLHTKSSGIGHGVPNG